MTDQDRICTCCGNETYFYRWPYRRYICEECNRLLPRASSTSLVFQLQFVRLIQQICRLTNKVLEQERRLETLEGQKDGTT